MGKAVKNRLRRGHHGSSGKKIVENFYSLTLARLLADMERVLGEGVKNVVMGAFRGLVTGYHDGNGAGSCAGLTTRDRRVHVGDAGGFAQCIGLARRCRADG